MSQDKVLKILEKLDENEWISSSELTRLTAINRSTINTNTKQLRKFNEIESRWTYDGLNRREHEHRLTWRGRQ